jgi:hypothetical protein
MTLRGRPRIETLVVIGPRLRGDDSGKLVRQLPHDAVEPGLPLEADAGPLR